MPRPDGLAMRAAMEVTLYNRQRAAALPIERLRTVSKQAALRCLTHPGGAPSVLQDLSAVEISFVSDRVIARIHRQFMDVSGPTDVITFPHGEIVISVGTAVQQALQNDEVVAREVARYVVHGFLHLHGHDDMNAADAVIMWSVQEKVLEQIWPKIPSTVQDD